MDKIFDKHGVPVIAILLGSSLIIIGITNGEIGFLSIVIPALQLSNLVRFIISLGGIALVLGSLFLYYLVIVRDKTPTAFGLSTTKDNQSVFYDATKVCKPHDFKGKNGQHWDNEKKGVAGPVGHGNISISKGIINIRRKDNVGRYDVDFLSFLINGTEVAYLPKDESLSGKRKIIVSGQIKSPNGTHICELLFKDKRTYQNTSHSIEIKGNEWKDFDLPFHLSPSSDYIFRIYHMSSTAVESSVQIRKFKVLEVLSKDNE